MQSSANSLFLKVFSACRRIAFYSVVFVTVAGCAWLQNEPELSAPDIGGFAVKGRMAVRQGTEGFSANFQWRHAGARDEIDLWGPIGQGHSRLVGDSGLVTVYTARGEVYRERDADVAMQRWLGFTLPIAALTHWIRGEPAPWLPVLASRSDDAGDLTMLEQLAWRLEFSDYGDDSDARRLPGRIIAIRGDVKVTLIPSEWSFGEPSVI